MKKVYQINSVIIVAADGWVEASNLQEAKDKWCKALREDANHGLAVMDVEIHDAHPPTSQYYDIDNAPSLVELEENKGIIISDYKW